MSITNTVAALAASFLTGGLVTGAYTVGQQSVAPVAHYGHPAQHGQHHHPTHAETHHQWEATP
jgi:predicted GNAT superfamily acetyltransferase